MSVKRERIDIYATYYDYNNLFLCTANRFMCVLIVAACLAYDN